jgi:hypothetical protein
MNFTSIPFDTPINWRQFNIIDNPEYENGVISFATYVHDKHLYKDIFFLGNEIGLTASLAGASAKGGALVGLHGSLIALGSGGTALFAYSLPIAAIAGLALFEGIVVAVNIASICKSPAYLQWKAIRKQWLANESLKKFVVFDTILKHLICPITKKIPVIPAANQQDVTYDFDAASKWIQENPGKPLPGSTVVSTLGHLTFDYAHVNSVVERFVNLGDLLRAEGKIKLCKNLLLSPSDPNTHRLLDICFIAAKNLGVTVLDLFSAKPSAKETASLDFIGKASDHCFAQFYTYRDMRLFQYNTKLKAIKLDPTLSKIAKKQQKRALEGRSKQLKLVKKKQYNAWEQFFRSIFLLEPDINLSRETPLIGGTLDQTWM